MSNPRTEPTQVHGLRMIVSAGGFVIGIVFGWLTRQILKIIKRSGHKAPEQLSLSVAMAYLTFYIANGPGRSPIPYRVLALRQGISMLATLLVAVTVGSHGLPHPERRKWARGGLMNF